MKNAIRFLTRPRHLFLITAGFLACWIVAVIVAVSVEEPAVWYVVGAVSLAAALMGVQVSTFAHLGSINGVRKAVGAVARSVSVVSRKAAKLPVHERGAGRESAELDQSALVDAIELLAKAVHAQSVRADVAQDEQAASMRRLEDRLVRSWESWAAAEQDLDDDMERVEPRPTVDEVRRNG